MFKRSSHAVFDCRYHLIWTVKYRKRALAHKHEREECERLLRRAATEYGMEVEAAEVDSDHVHLYIQIPPQRSVGRAVGILKSISARMMFKRFPYLRRKLWAGELWSAGYFARTVGEGVTGAVVKKYIESHEERALGPAQAELFPAAEKAKPDRRRKK
jgi:putative transposase